VVLLLAVTHYIACGWYIIADDQPPSWIFKYFETGNYTEMAPVDLYVTTVYYAVSTITMVGTGDLVAANSLERVYSLLLCLVGSSLNGYIIVKITTIVYKTNTTENRLRQRNMAIRSYLIYRKVPAQIGKRISRYFKYFYARQSGFGEDELFASLTTDLRNELSVFMLGDMVRKLNIFQAISDPERLTEVAKGLKPLYIGSGDPVICAGDAVSELMFLSKGRIAEIRDGLVVRYIEPGDHIGEIDEIDDQLHEGTFMAIDNCDMFTMSRENALEISASIKKAAHNVEEYDEELVEAFHAAKEIAVRQQKELQILLKKVHSIHNLL